MYFLALYPTTALCCEQKKEFKTESRLQDRFVSKTAFFLLSWPLKLDDLAVLKLPELQGEVQIYVY